MNESDNGGYALPREEADMRQVGMTLRDYFAAKAMQAAATNPTGADGFSFEERARWAYAQAEAMLEARKQ
jgi:hypothetical protein